MLKPESKSKKYYFIFSEGSCVNQIICAILINFPVFVYGSSIGWMSPMTLLLQSDDSPAGRKLTDTEISWMASAGYFVCIPCDFLVAILSDRIGRKYTLLFVSATSACCWIIKLSSVEIWAFVLARSLIGIIMAGSYVTCPLYTKEISEDKIRGFLGTLVILFHTSGNLFAYIIGDLWNYTTVLIVCLSLPAVHLILFTMMPESPSYLIKKGKEEQAAKVIAWLRCRDVHDSVVQTEVNLIKKEQKADSESSRYVFKAIMADKVLRRAFAIATVVVITREFCGAIPVMNFAGDIFETATRGTGFVLTGNQQAMVLGAIQVTGSLLGSSVVDFAGRKMLFFTTSLLSGLSMCALASWFLLKDLGILAPAWLPIMTLCLCIFCDSSGLQPVSVVITCEMFSFKYRGTVVATTMALASVFAFLQMLFFKPLCNTLGIHVAFYMFCGICLAAALYAIIVIPETKQKSLQEIHEKLKTKKEREAQNESGKEMDAVKDVVTAC